MWYVGYIFHTLNRTPEVSPQEWIQLTAPVAGYYEHSNETLVSVKREECVD